MNGKSGNINNVCSQMYPPGTRVPGSELICVFDADQVASKEFFMKTIPMFDGGKLPILLDRFSSYAPALFQFWTGCLIFDQSWTSHCYVG